MAYGQRGHAGCNHSPAVGGHARLRPRPRGHPTSPFVPHPRRAPAGLSGRFALAAGAGEGGALPPTLPGGRGTSALPTVSGMFRVEDAGLPVGDSGCKSRRTRRRPAGSCAGVGVGFRGEAGGLDGLA